MALAGRHASRVRMRHATRRWRRGKHRAGRCGAGRRGAGRRGASSRGVGRRGARRGGPCGGRGAPGGLASCREVRWHVASYYSTHPSRPSPHCVMSSTPHDVPPHLTIDTTPTHQVRRVRLRAHRAARRAYLRHGCLRHACLRHACACATPACAMPATPRWPLPVPQCAVARIITARPTLHIPLAFPPSYNRTPDLSFLCA